MPKTSIKFVEKGETNGYDEAASYNERFRRSQIRRGRNCIYYQRCMLAVAYGTTVAVFMINSYITILRCFCKQINKKVDCSVNANVNGKSATSVSQ
jgi:hypothetical protein